MGMNNGVIDVLHSARLPWPDLLLILSC